MQNLNTLLKTPQAVEKLKTKRNYSQEILSYFIIIFQTGKKNSLPIFFFFENFYFSFFALAALDVTG